MSTTETTLLDFGEDRGDWDGVFEYIECRRALSPSRLPEMNYALNPYTGCEHGCIYCYGPGVVHAEPSTWRVVRVKRNIPERLSRELPAVDGIIGIGTVTDPYQYAERRFMLTRMCLEVLARNNREIHMHTKSDLILRDKELLSGMRGVVGITVTTMDERISKMTEPGAPVPSRRLEAMAELHDAGVNVYALIAPVMNTLEGHESELLDAVRSTGVRIVYHNPLHFRNVDDSRLKRMGIGPSRTAEDRLSSIGGYMGLDVRDVFESRYRWSRCVTLWTIQL